MGVLNFLNKNKRKDETIKKLQKELEGQKKERLSFMKVQTELEKIKDELITTKEQFEITKQKFQEVYTSEQNLREEEFFLRFISYLEKGKKSGEIYNFNCSFFERLYELNTEQLVVFSFSKYFIKIYSTGEFHVYDAFTMKEITINNRNHTMAIKQLLEYKKNKDRYCLRYISQDK